MQQNNRQKQQGGRDREKQPNTEPPARCFQLEDNLSARHLDCRAGSFSPAKRGKYNRQGSLRLSVASAAKSLQRKANKKHQMLKSNGLAGCVCKLRHRSQSSATVTRSATFTTASRTSCMPLRMRHFASSGQEHFS